MLTMNKMFYQKPESELLHVMFEGNYCGTLKVDPNSDVINPWITEDDEEETW